ncbi:MAG: MFS transporter [Phycisphaerae bacterium]|nr:MFS transporter [Phycisphaerae bacterium]
MGSDLPTGTKSSRRFSVLFRLSVMMLLQYAVWGAWLPIAARYLMAPKVEIEFTDLGGLSKDIFAQSQADALSPGKRIWELLTPAAREMIATAAKAGKVEKPAELIAALRKTLADDRSAATSSMDSAAVFSANCERMASAYPKFCITGRGGLGFTGSMVGWILGLAGSIGAICAPFIAGQVADRYFSAQKALAALLLIGGAVKWYTAYQDSYSAWLVLSIVYSIVYMPTLALSNSIAFAHMRDQEREFPLVRVWGTIGWILVGFIFPVFWLQSKIQLQWLPPFYVSNEIPFVTHHLVNALKFAGVLSFLYAGYCLLLPDTPPRKEGVEPLAFAKAFRLLRKRSVLLIVLASLPISVIHQIYFMQTAPFLSAIGLPDSYITPAMSIGQLFEIIVMAMLGVLLTRLGFRRVIFIGAIAYFARYAVFGTVHLPPALIVASQFLHGFCYACFFAGTFIYIDRIAPRDIRHSAQTLYAIFILGLGPVIGGWLNGALEDWFKGAGSPNMYIGIWYTQAAIALVTGLVFVLLFRSELGEPEPASAAASPLAAPSRGE